MRVTVLRAYFARGKRAEVGDEHDVPDGLARELIASGKAQISRSTSEPAQQQAPARAAPLTTQSAGAIVRGGKAKE